MSLSRLLTPIDIGSCRVPNRLFAAPMAGISDLPFRFILKSFGAGMTFSEMISTEAFVRGHEKTRGILRRSEGEIPFGIQIFGGNPSAMAETARRLETEGLCDLIDINLGCPVRKVMRSGAGAALMMDGKRLFEAVERVIDAVSLPVTAKLRACRAPGDTMGLELIPQLFSAGIRAVTLHARCVSWSFSHPPEWTWIKKAAGMGRPLIGNGGIVTPEDAVEMAGQTGCDGIMIARGYLGNPWIFRDLRCFIETGSWTPVPLEERFETMKTHFELSLEVFGKEQGVLKMRKHLAWYVKGLPGNADFRRQINRCGRADEVLTVIESYYERLVRARKGGKTGPRPCKKVQGSSLKVRGWD